MISAIPMRLHALDTGRLTNRIIRAVAVFAAVVATLGAGADTRVVATLGAGADTRVVAPRRVRVVGPYSPGVLAGEFLYVSGQGGRDTKGRLRDTIEGQVRQTLVNLKGIVEAGGLTMAPLIYCHVYLTR